MWIRVWPRGGWIRPWIREESSVSEERFGGAAYGGGRSAEAEARGQHNLVAGETHANGTPMDRQQHDNTTAQTPDGHAVGGDGSDARMARILSAAREAAGQHGARPYQREIILDCLGHTESPRSVATRHRFCSARLARARRPLLTASGE